MTTVDELAQVIRQVDGNHTLGAGALAEAILEKLPHIAARQPSKQPDSVALGEATEFCIENGARQPVGQKAVVTSHWRDGELNHILYCSPMPDGVHRLYAAPPAQAVDLGPVHAALQAAARSLRTIADSTKDTEFLETASEIRAYANSRANCAEQAMIDSQAVGNK